MIESTLPDDNWVKEVLLDPTWHQWHYANGVNGIGFDRHEELFRNVVKWIKLMAFNEDDVKWMKMNDCIYTRFRNEAEYLAFLLKFGPGT